MEFEMGIKNQSAVSSSQVSMCEQTQNPLKDTAELVSDAHMRHLISLVI